MTSPYTRGDSFSSEASRKHIRQALTDYGATDILFTQRGDRSAVAFRGAGRQFRIVMPLLQSDGALALAIDAKLGAAAAGIATLESEFLAHVVLPGNHTVLDELASVIDSAYRSGRRPSFADPVPHPGPEDALISVDSKYLGTS